ncbi:hypothetical protein NDK47_05830 [Brevibacillus ruminantium]|uniref:Spore coat protein YutH n=1 Tax=Brevibacillus ruminantium TaxID=2950604 RepID=A0ABY4WL01_9BACL|nr:hypothetical protein [Brevibacillus ruminantium]USG66818.1 hypothetical protein NDK47_05830 [Brevibacillus ruminantium]
MEYRQLLQEQYGFSLINANKKGPGTALKTDQGLFYLFEAPAIYKYKSKFVERVRKELSGRGEPTLLGVMKTVKGQPHTVHDDQILYLYRGVREATPDHPYYACGQVLARFHQGTGSFKGDKLFLPYSSLGSWPAMWRKKLREYEGYRDDLDERDVEIIPFDEYLLTSYTYVHQLGETAVQYLYHADYERVIKETAGCGKVAYQNFEQDYIVWDEERGPFLTGEWNWVLDMRARDIGQWIKTEVRRHGWQEEKIASFLDGYNSVTPLLENEYAIIYGLMLYPGRFLKLVEAYRELPLEEKQKVDDSGWKQQMDEELMKMEEALLLYPRMIHRRYSVPIPQIDWLWRSDDDDETTRVRDEAVSQRTD